MKAFRACIPAALILGIVCGRTAAAKPRYSETEITFHSGGLKLYGTLDLPTQRKGRVPGIVLVHGSGPHNRDETLAALKPFQDIGRGLAERGIAVLRYDKRTLTYGSTWTQKQVAELTVKEEVIDDTLAAAQFLRKRKEIDPKRVFVLGHSLGGWAAPMICRQDRQAAGIVMLAASAADLDKTIIRQVKRQSRLGMIPKEAADKLVSETRQGFEDLRAGKFPDDKFLLGMSGKYLKDFLARDPVSDLTKLAQPVLILQGDKDYQVTVADDLAIWEKALKNSGKTNYRIVRFPTHNHAFVSIKGESTSAEYFIPAHVDPKVIDTIAQWIKSVK